MWIILQEMLPILTQNHFRNTKTRVGGHYQAGLYPVSANVPLGGQTGATPDGRYAHTPVADGVSPSAGKDVKGPTAAATSVSRLDHFIVLATEHCSIRNSIRLHLQEERAGEICSTDPWIL